MKPVRRGARLVDHTDLMPTEEEVASHDRCTQEKRELLPKACSGYSSTYAVFAEKEAAACHKLIRG